MTQRRVRPTVVTIAGLDPTGCAGIHADIRVIESLGCHAASVITTLTFQNTLGARGAQPVSAENVVSQLDAVCDDLDVRAVKIGMLTRRETSEALAATLRESGHFTVVDPIATSSTGFSFSKQESLESVYGPLLAIANLITPNADEAAQLVGAPVRTLNDAREAGKKLLDLGCQAVLLKGGHLEQNQELATDVLVTRKKIELFSGRPLLAEHQRGTGCALSSAIAAQIARGTSLEDAISIARRVIRHGRLGGFAVGKGPGPIHTRPHFDTQAPSRVGRLHIITTETLQEKYSHQEIAHLAVQGGADVVQYREKRDQTCREQLKSIQGMQQSMATSHCQLVVNDRSDLARIVGAGLHVGPGDVAPKVARNILGPSAIIGATANNPHMLAALEDAPIDYVGVGPVFKTTSKENPAKTLGLKGLAQMVEQSHVPVIAIGSIRPDQVRDVLKTGAHGVAVISGVVLQDDPQHAAATYRNAIDAFLTSETAP